MVERKEGKEVVYGGCCRCESGEEVAGRRCEEACGRAAVDKWTMVGLWWNLPLVIFLVKFLLDSSSQMQLCLPSLLYGPVPTLLAFI